MLQRSNDVTQDAVFKAVGSFLVLGIAPALRPFLDLFKALLQPAQGIFKWLHKAYEVWKQASEMQQEAHTGSLLEHLKIGYAFAAYFAILVVALFVVVTMLSLLSRRLPRNWAAPFEVLAAAIWLIPYWTFKVLSSVMIIGVSLALIVGLLLGMIQAFRTLDFLSAVLGSLFAIGLFTILFAAVSLTFWVTLSPPYLCLRYVVPFGLIWGQPDGLARRTFCNAFREGRHFPFWMGE
jgi:hypothetical protein